MDRFRTGSNDKFDGRIKQSKKAKITRHYDESDHSSFVSNSEDSYSIECDSLSSTTSSDYSVYSSDSKISLNNLSKRKLRSNSFRERSRSETGSRSHFRNYDSDSDESSVFSFGRGAQNRPSIDRSRGRKDYDFGSDSDSNSHDSGKFSSRHGRRKREENKKSYVSSNENFENGLHTSLHVGNSPLKLPGLRSGSNLLQPFQQPLCAGQQLMRSNGSKSSTLSSSFNRRDQKLQTTIPSGNNFPFTRSATIRNSNNVEQTIFPGQQSLVSGRLINDFHLNQDQGQRMVGISGNYLQGNTNPQMAVGPGITMKPMSFRSGQEQLNRPNQSAQSSSMRETSHIGIGNENTLLETAVHRRGLVRGASNRSLGNSLPNNTVYSQRPGLIRRASAQGLNSLPKNTVDSQQPGLIRCASAQGLNNDRLLNPPIPSHQAGLIRRAPQRPRSNSNPNFHKNFMNSHCPRLMRGASQRSCGDGNVLLNATSTQSNLNMRVNAPQSSYIGTKNAQYMMDGNILQNASLRQPKPNIRVNAPQPSYIGTNNAQYTMDGNVLLNASSTQSNPNIRANAPRQSYIGANNAQWTMGGNELLNTSSTQSNTNMRANAPQQSNNRMNDAHWTMDKDVLMNASATQFNPNIKANIPQQSYIGTKTAQWTVDDNVLLNDSSTRSNPNIKSKAPQQSDIETKKAQRTVNSTTLTPVTRDELLSMSEGTSVMSSISRQSLPPQSLADQIYFRTRQDDTQSLGRYTDPPGVFCNHLNKKPKKIYDDASYGKTAQEEPDGLNFADIKEDKIMQEEPDGLNFADIKEDKIMLDDASGDGEDRKSSSSRSTSDLDLGVDDSGSVDEEVGNVGVSDNAKEGKINKDDNSIQIDNEGNQVNEEDTGTTEVSDYVEEEDETTEVFQDNNDEYPEIPINIEFDSSNSDSDDDRDEDFTSKSSIELHSKYASYESFEDDEESYITIYSENSGDESELDERSYESCELSDDQQVFYIEDDSSVTSSDEDPSSKAGTNVYCRESECSISDVSVSFFTSDFVFEFKQDAAPPKTPTLLKSERVADLSIGDNDNKDRLATPQHEPLNSSAQQLSIQKLTRTIIRSCSEELVGASIDDQRDCPAKNPTCEDILSSNTIEHCGNISSIQEDYNKPKRRGSSIFDEIDSRLLEIGCIPKPKASCAVCITASAAESEPSSQYRPSTPEEESDEEEVESLLILAEAKNLMEVARWYANPTQQVKSDNFATAKNSFTRPFAPRYENVEQRGKSNSTSTIDTTTQEFHSVISNRETFANGYYTHFDSVSSFPGDESKVKRSRKGGRHKNKIKRNGPRVHDGREKRVPKSLENSRVEKHSKKKYSNRRKKKTRKIPDSPVIASNNTQDKKIHSKLNTLKSWASKSLNVSDKINGLKKLMNDDVSRKDKKCIDQYTSKAEKLKKKMGSGSNSRKTQSLENKRRTRRKKKRTNDPTKKSTKNKTSSMASKTSELKETQDFTTRVSPRSNRSNNRSKYELPKVETEARTRNSVKPIYSRYDATIKRDFDQIVDFEDQSVMNLIDKLKSYERDQY